MQGRRAARTGGSTAVHWTRAALALLVACAFALMPLSMAQARAAGTAQTMGHHTETPNGHCAEPNRTPRENPLLAADTCALACSVVLPAAASLAPVVEPEPAPLVATQARSLQGIAPDICLPPPRTASEA